MTKQPTKYIVRKIVWAILLITGIIFIIVASKSVGNFDNEIIELITFLGVMAFPAALSFIPWAFKFEFDKIRKKIQSKKKQKQEIEED